MRNKIKWMEDEMSIFLCIYQFFLKNLMNKCLCVYMYENKLYMYVCIKYLETLSPSNHDDEMNPTQLKGVGDMPNRIRRRSHTEKQIGKKQTRVRTQHDS